MLKVGVCNTTTFSVTDVALKSGSSNRDRQYSGETPLRMTTDTINLSRKNKQTMPLNNVKKPTFKFNFGFNFENLIKAGLVFMLVFGLYVIGGAVLLLLSGIGIASFILFLTLGLIPKNLLESPRMQAQMKKSLTRPLTFSV